MYKLLLCWRYLRTRWIALASIISVTLGVATMIVVNSVMEGFRHEMQERIHGILSDVVFESNSLAGFYDPAWHMEQIRQVAGDYIEGMTPTVVVPAMLSYEYNGTSITRPVQLIGIDAKTQSEVGDFCQYLQHPANRQHISFELREDGYDVVDHQAGIGAADRTDLSDAGWIHRRKWVERKKMLESLEPRADRAGDEPTPFAPQLAEQLHEQLTPTIADPAPAPPPANLAAPASLTVPAEIEAPTVEGELTDVGETPSKPTAPQREANITPTAAEFAIDQPGLPTGESGNPLREMPSTLEPPTAPAATDGFAPIASEANTPLEEPPVAAAVYPAENGTDDQLAGAARDAVDRFTPPANAPVQEPTPAVVDPFAGHGEPAATFDPTKEQHPGVVLGIATVTHPLANGRTLFLAKPGDDVRLSFPNAGTPPDVEHATFTVIDLYESKMSEYDASFVFVPIETLQQFRGMFDPETKVGYATSIQIKLKPGADGQKVRDMLRGAFTPQLFSISTWRDKQGPLLAAVQMETAILNVLLFMIIFVAGFGILAIFFMIVVEKTRDIGILKALGASRRGILGIFLGYGLSLGIVGAGAGMTIGLLFVAYINEIADLLGMITGQEVFDPTIYYFQQIPTIVEPVTVAWIVLGALVIAVLASVLPARRAARLHPVEALRYE